MHKNLFPETPEVLIIGGQVLAILTVLPILLTFLVSSFLEVKDINNI